MGKSKKFKFCSEIKGEIHNDELSTEKSQLHKMKNKNKTPFFPDKTEKNQNFVNYDETETTKKKKKKKSSNNNETETEISKLLANENEKTPIFSQMRETKKQKKKIKFNKENESIQSLLQTEMPHIHHSFLSTETKTKKKTVESPAENVGAEMNSVGKKTSKKRKRELMEESVSNVEVRKKKKIRLVDEDEDNVEEPESGSKAKKRNLKNLTLKNESTSRETVETDSEPKQKSKKKPQNKPEHSDEVTSDNENSRDSRSIFIGNVPVEYNKKALTKLLKEKGNLQKCWTRGFFPKSDKISKKTAAIANLLSEEQPPVVVYALFETAADAKNALTLNGAIFEDHRLRVTYSSRKRCPAELGVFVGNLPSNITDDDLHEFFRQCGKIVSTRVVRNNQGRGRGVAFVNFESTDSVELALKLHEEKLRGREIRVTRLKNERQLNKMQKRKMLQASKDALISKKHKTKKTELSSDKSDKFQRKKKKPNSVEIKKKILAEKLTSTTKRKEKKSE